MKLALAAALALPMILLAACGEKAAENGSTPSARVGPVKAVPPPAGKSWTETVTAMPDGGYRVGNPDAPLQLVEYGSFTCSHCADFATSSHESLMRDYVATGKVAFEFRSYLRDPLDLSASLLAQCGGPQSYFPLMTQIMGAQREWIGKMQQLGQPEIDALNKLPPKELVAAFARLSGLDSFVQQRGVPAQKVTQCLADQKVIQQLEASVQRANTEFQLSATPTFILNGRKLEKAASWADITAELKANGA